MPQRTTLFQRAVYYIKRNLADATTQEVTESKMLVDSATGEDREVDVVLTGRVGEYSIVIGIECNERTRRAGTPWVESMHAKHATLPTDKLILVSQAGFSAPAERKADYLGHVTVTPDTPTEETLDEVIRNLKGLFIASFDILVDSTYFELAPKDDFRGTVILCDDSYLVYRQSGEPVGRVGQFVDSFRNGITQSIVRKPVTLGWSHYQWTLAPDGDSSTRFYLRAESPIQRLLEVNKIIVVGRVRIQQNRIALTPGILEGVSHSYGQADVAGQNATAFVTAVGEGTAQVNVEITGKPDLILDSE